MKETKPITSSEEILTGELLYKNEYIEEQSPSGYIEDVEVINESTAQLYAYSDMSRDAVLKTLGQQSLDLLEVYKRISISGWLFSGGATASIPLYNPTNPLTNEVLGLTTPVLHTLLKVDYNASDPDLQITSVRLVGVRSQVLDRLTSEHVYRKKGMCIPRCFILS